MTKDFTKIGRSSQVSKEDSSGGTGDVTARSQRFVLLAIWCAAGGFLLAGVWLLLGMPSPFAPEISLYLGIGFIVSTVADVIAIKFIKRAWAKQQGQ